MSCLPAPLLRCCASFGMVVSVTILTTFAVYDRPDGNGDSDPKNKASVTALTLACALFFLSAAGILLAVRRPKFVWREVSPFGYIFVALLVCSVGCGVAALVGFVKQRDSFRPCPADADGDDCHFDLDFSGIGAGMSAGFVCTAILVLLCQFVKNKDQQRDQRRGGQEPEQWDYYERL